MAVIVVLGIVCFLTVSTVAQIGQGGDGNPHGWDRNRRCDHVDYDPPCGVCEGFGGIPYGDENDQITLTTCEVVANSSQIDPNTLKRPIWARTTEIHSWEILIGKKTDPFCFQAFPGNSSEGELCYRPQTGIQYYDFANARAIREDLDVSTPVGNVTTTVLHQGRNFWVINKLPWYAAGVHQCICTQAHEGADATKPGVYPVDTNWTDNLGYVGREEILVEYDQGVHVLDHWAFGPHHVWSFPESGQILRMWQPFNGLQVFPTGAQPSKIDPALFDDIPPSLCKKENGATFRIKCSDTGYPDPLPPPENEVNVSASKFADEERATRKIPGHSFRGEDFADMSRVLNGWLHKDPLFDTKPCDDFNLTEVQQLQAMLFLMRDSSFDVIYKSSNDNRKIVGELKDIQNTWEKFNKIINESSSPEYAHDLLRDGHCHEAVMWYTHHLTYEVKQLIADSGIPLVIPLLSTAKHDICYDEIDEPSIREVCRSYVDKVTCASCHSDVP